MRPIRVLIVDDSAVVRRIVTKLIEAEPGIEVAGIAQDGKIALERIAQLKPDIVSLDLEMPVLDGLGVLAELRRLQSKVPVIIFSAISEAGAEATLKALTLGASDYVTKPSQLSSIADSMSAIGSQLIEKIRALCPHGIESAPAKQRLIQRPTEFAPCGIVAIGTSTGGPKALERVMAALPADLGVPVVIVQHMPPLFTRTLAKTLDDRCPLTVQEAHDGALLKPGCAWVAPGDFHMELKREDVGVRIVLGKGPKEHSCRPAVDPLFRSVANAYREHAFGVVMTGMGKDGGGGAKAIREVGGQIVAQDEATSVVWGMPGFVVEAGLANAVLPLDRIGEAVTAAARAGSRRGAR